MSTYIDLLLDSNSPEVDSDNPSFTLYPDAQNVVGISVVWANIPTSYTVVDLANAYFLWQETGMPVPVSLKFTTGTYDANTVKTEIQALLVGLPNGPSYVVTINPATNKLTISNDAISFRFAFYANSSSLADMLGFESRTTGNSNENDVFDWKSSINGEYAVAPGQLSPVTNYVTSTKAIELLGPSILSIRSPSVRNTARSHDHLYSTLVNFPTRSLFGSSTVYQNAAPAPVRMSNQFISEFQVYLTLGRRTVYWNEKKQTPVNYLSLNGTGWQVVVRLYMENRTAVLRG